jgi:uncharacterized protein
MTVGQRSRAFGLVLLASSACWAGAARAEVTLVDAAESGDVVAVNALLDAGARVDERAVDGTAALHWAVREDHADVVRALLESGADPRAKDRYGVTPLYLAAVNGNAGIVASLLDSGADASARSPMGETMLMTAVRTGAPSAVAELVAHGAAVDVREPEFEQTALMLAVREGHPRVVEMLLAEGAAADARTRVGPTPEFTPPCKGTGCGSEGVGINRGGLPDRGRRNPAAGGMTSLLYAARDGRLEEARLLVDAGADVEIAEANGVRPLLMALLNNQLGVARLLLERGADPNAEDFWGRSPLFAAVEYRNLDMNNRDEDSPTDNGVAREPILAMIESLLAQGADVDARTREVPPSRRWLYSLGDVSWVDFTGQTPFLRAALSGDTTTMRLLLDHGADPNLASEAGAAPLYAAVNVTWAPHAFYPQPSAAQEKTSLPRFVEALLVKDADPNRRLTRKVWYTGYNFDQSGVDETGATAFWRAAQASDIETMRILVKHGAKPDIWSMVLPDRRAPNGRNSGEDLDKLPPVPVGGPAVSPLHVASGAGFDGNFHRNAPVGWLPAVKYLVDELGFDVNQPDYKGYTPLHNAAFRGDNDMIRYLVEKGADAKAVARNGQTTVDMANGPIQRLQPFPETIALLESLGAKNNHKCVSC